MRNVGRNESCPCGSGKKFKNCYGKITSNCSLLMHDQREKVLKEHAERDGEVFKFLNSVIEEVGVVLLKDEKGNDQIPMRIQMLIIFSLVDVLASYWYEYQNRQGKTNERAMCWYDSFCSTERNEFWKDLWREVSSERLYRFRNSLVHFFGMGERLPEDIAIMLGPNNHSDQEKERFEKGLLKMGHKSIMIRPNDFANLIRQGGILMLEDWQDELKAANTDPALEKEYIASIERVWSKVRKEGAVAIPKH